MYTKICTKISKTRKKSEEKKSSSAKTGCSDEESVCIPAKYDYLMGSNDVVQIVGSQECFRYIWTKLDSHASFGWRTPSLWLWIRPQKIAHDT